MLWLANGLSGKQYSVATQSMMHKCAATWMHRSSARADATRPGIFEYASRTADAAPRSMGRMASSASKRLMTAHRLNMSLATVRVCVRPWRTTGSDPAPSDARKMPWTVLCFSRARLLLGVMTVNRLIRPASSVLALSSLVLHTKAPCSREVAMTCVRRFSTIRHCSTTTLCSVRICLRWATVSSSWVLEPRDSASPHCLRGVSSSKIKRLPWSALYWKADLVRLTAEDTRPVGRMSVATEQANDLLLLGGPANRMFRCRSPGLHSRKQSSPATNNNRIWLWHECTK